MRIIHTSDWHLGHELHEYARGTENDAFLNWLLKQIQDTSADALIVTGDLYDVTNPAVDAQQRFYRFLRESLAQSPHLQIVVVGGNHDSPARIELPKELVDPERVFLIGAMPYRDGQLDTERIIIPLRNGGGVVKAVCVSVPFLRPGDVAHYGPEQDGVAALYTELVQKAAMFAGHVPVIVTGHLHVRGGMPSEWSERRIFVGGSEAVPAEVFPEGVAYVALGHLHRPQVIAPHPEIRYAGAPFPMSMDEREYQHSIVVVDVNVEHVSTSTIPVPRPVRFLRVPENGALLLAQVESALRALDVGDVTPESRPYLEIFVRVETAEPDLRQRIEAALEGKSVRLTRVVRQTSGQGGSLADGLADAPDLSELLPEEVFRRMHVQEFSDDPPEVMMKSFRELVSSVSDKTAAEVGAN